MSETDSLLGKRISHCADMSFEIKNPKTEDTSRLDRILPFRIYDPSITGRSTIIPNQQAWTPLVVDRTLTGKPEKWTQMFREGLRHTLPPEVLPEGAKVECLEMSKPWREYADVAGTASLFDEEIRCPKDWNTTYKTGSDTPKMSVFIQNYHVRARRWKPKTQEWISESRNPAALIRVSMEMSDFQDLEGRIAGATEDGAVTVSPPKKTGRYPSVCQVDESWVGSRYG